ncbi:MAG: DUF1674 domain-containing protein [Alphaproteobacteria bacterium]|nr:DUF1674 domain-containing protein [Alphaproteobacteria bacterium]
MAEESINDGSKAAPAAKAELRLAVEIPAKKLSPEAQRALTEAAERRRAAAAQPPEAPEFREINGPEGLEPTRYGDWERKGIISDF